MFQYAARQSRFLEYVTSKTLADEQSEIKEYTLGVEVFDRPESFDPKADSIVRVEARKLRLNLAKYYETEGAADPWRIELPKGAYIPAFVENHTVAVVPAPRVRKLVWVAAAVALLLVGFGWRTVRSGVGPPPPGVDAMAVLPPIVLSGDAKDRMLADGIASQLIDSLCRLEGVRVASQASSFQFRDEKVDYGRIADTLGAGTLIESSLQRAGDRVRVMVRVTNARTGTTFWSHQFDFTGSDWLRWQEEIAEEVASALSLRRMPRDSRALARHTSANEEISDLYLRSQFGFSQTSKEGLEQANILLERILEKEPSFVPAVVSLANNHIALHIFGYHKPHDAARLARQYAERAIGLDASLADPYAALGFLAAAYDWNWPEAEWRFQQAIALNPNCAHCRAWYAYYYLAPQRKLKEAELQIAKTIELDPLPINWHALTAGIPYVGGDFATAEAKARSVLERKPKNFMASLFLGAALRMQGRAGEAVKVLEDGLRLAPGFTGLQRNLGEAYAAVGDVERARSIMATLEAGGEGVLRNAASIAMIQAGLGDVQRAADLLDRAREQREPYLLNLPVSPLALRLRDDGRFRALVKEIGLEFRL